ncbi:MAG: fibronectin type III domain-containing protein [Spirochaetota bacterium]|nr:fibronectin type III domain-containing protein [Spirochaetota bacterium]
MKKNKDYFTEYISLKSILQWLYTPIMILMLSLFSIGWKCNNDIELSLPLSPNNLIANAATSSLIELNWQDNSANEVGFKIEKKYIGESFIEIETVAPDVTSFNDIGFIEGITYYRVRAFNDNGFSEYSNEAKAILEEDCIESDPSWQNHSLTESLYDTFTADVVVIPDNDNIDGIFAFSDGSGATFSDFAILVRFNETGLIDIRNGDSYEADETVPYTLGICYQFRLAVDVTNHTFSVYVTPENTSETMIAMDYIFRTEQNTVTNLNNIGVWADDGGSLQVCNLTITSTEPTEPPAAPSNLDIQSISPNRIDLIWNDNSNNEQEFRIEKKISDGTFIEIATVPKNTEIFSDTSVAPETPYSYKIRAYNIVDYSGYSNEISTTTPPQPPPTDGIIIDHTCTKLTDIPVEYVAKVKEELSVHYCGRSHACQIYWPGLREVDSNGGGNWDYYYPSNDTPLSNNSRLDLVHYIGSDPGIEPHEYFGGNSDSPAWDSRPYPIETYLDAHPEINVAGIEWCGELHLTNQGANSNYVDGYIRAMSNLEERYNGANDRKITFVYFTTNTQYRDDDTDMGGSNLDEKQARAHLNNERIRAHCYENNCVLYDFADLDIYCPVDGNGDFDPNSDNWVKEPNRSAVISYSDETHDNELRNISFPVSYMGGPGNVNPIGWGNYNITYYHTTLAHAEIKGQAFWYLLARIAGWDGQ